MLQAPVNAWFAEELSARSWFDRDSATGRKVYSHVGSGGANIGGVGSALIRNPVFAYAGSGGNKVSGVADTLKRASVLTYVATGGALSSGAATANVIKPVIYYIDPINGNDANNALSWANAVKTFAPFANGTIPLLASYKVYIAKTPNAVARGTVTRQITSNEYAPSLPSNRGGWPSTSTLFNTVDGYFDNVVVIDPLSSWTSLVDAKFTSTTVRMPPYANTVQRLMFNYSGGTGYTQNMLLAYRTTSVTIPASFTRLEVRYGLNVGNNVSGTSQKGTPWEVTLCLCSDSVGQTTVLAIPLSHTATSAGIFVYQGALPSTVNSVALRMTSQGTTTYHTFHLFSLIATKPLSDVNYLGHFTQWKFGDHDGAYWIPTESFSSSNSVVLTINMRGAASVNNTSVMARSRNTVGWDRFNWFSSSSTVYPTVGCGVGYDFTALDIYDYSPNPQVCTPTFFFKNINGSATDNIEIIGGVDPATNTVTGKTAISAGRPCFLDCDPYFSALVFYNSSYITFKNIDIYNFAGNLVTFEKNNNGIRFENCELEYGALFTASPPSLWYVLPSASTHIYDYAGGSGSFISTPRGTLTNVYFKNCIGQLYLYSQHYDAANDGNSSSRLFASTFSGLTLEDCILTPFSGYNSPTNAVYTDYFNHCPFMVLATVVGSLKIYAVANTVPSTPINLPASESRMFLPTFANGQSSTVYVYGAGCIWAVPAAEDGVLAASYSFPKLVLENTMLVYSSARTARGQNNAVFPLTYGVGQAGGEVEYIEFPEITINLTAGYWHARQSLAPSAYLFYFLIQPCQKEATPPTHIKKLTITGSTPSPTEPITYLVNLPTQATATLQISNVDFSGITSNQLRIAGVNFNGGDSYNILRTVNGPPLIIMDGVTSHAMSGTNNLYFFNGYLSGQVDLRNISYTHTGGGAVYFTPASAVLQSFSLTIRNSVVSPALPNLSNPAYTPLYNSTQYYQPVGYDAGITVIDSPTISPVSSIASLPTSTTTEFTSGNSLIVPEHTITLITTTPTVSHKSYLSTGPDSFCLIEKDFIVKNIFSFSWKMTCKYRLTSPYSLNLPLATLPVKLGKVVTITIYGRRSASNAYGGLMVYQNGCAGVNTPQDMQEFFTPISAASGTWQLLTCQFVCQMSGIIDIAWSHFGIEGGNTWFEYLKVVET